MTILDLIRRLSESPRTIKIQFHVVDHKFFLLVETATPASFVRHSIALSDLYGMPNPEAWLDWWIAEAASQVVGMAVAGHVPMKYVLAGNEDVYAEWLIRTKTKLSVYLDGEGRINDRIAPGCLIKLTGWHLNPAYTLAFRQALSYCATPEDWSTEDMAKGLVRQ